MFYIFKIPRTLYPSYNIKTFVSKSIFIVIKQIDKFLLSIYLQFKKTLYPFCTLSMGSAYKNAAYRWPQIGKHSDAGKQPAA